MRLVRYIDLKGLHMFNELREGSDIDTTENLEVEESFALERMELIYLFWVCYKTDRSDPPGGC